MVFRIAITTFILLVGAAPHDAQGQTDARADAPSNSAGLIELRAIPEIDGSEATRSRLDEVLGRWPVNGGMLRSASTMDDWTRSPVPLRLEIYLPRLETIWNSDLPSTANEGWIWAGKGQNYQVTAGARLDAGPLHITLAPAVTHSANEEIGVLQVIPYYPPDLYPPYYPLWYRDGVRIDMPIRLGSESLTQVHPGESTIAVDAGLLSFGASTERHWWGPGIRNAIVLSSNAPGFPHLFIRTVAPLETPLGIVEGRWLLGKLESSDLFERELEPSDRAIAGFAGTIQPLWVPNLTLGITRTLYGPVDSENTALALGHGVLTRWRGIRAVPVRGRAPHDQLLSLFGRWVLPAAGAEVYAEWARRDLPDSVRDLLLHPNHSQAYTLGLQWARPILQGSFRLQAELTNLEMSTNFRTGRRSSYYVSYAGNEGYTHRGRVLGASIGPGSSSQWLAVDYFAGRWNTGVFASRTRWDSDAFYDTPWAQLWGVPYHAHDVSVTGGIRGGFNWSRVGIEAEYSVENRINYLFQNWSVDWASTASSAVNVLNHRMRLSVSPRLPR